MLRIIPLTSPPDWIKNTGAEFLSTEPLIPIPWDPMFLMHWQEFIRAFGARYNGHAIICAIHMARAGTGGEMALGNEIPWEQFGYSDSLLIAAWEQIIDTYNSSFPSTQTVLNINEPIPGRSHVLDQVVTYALNRYSGKVSFQNNGLCAAGMPTYISDTIRQAAAQTSVGYQMLGGRLWLDAQTGDRATAFTNGLADKIVYAEIYLSDLLDLSLADAIHMFAEGLKANYEAQLP